ncbi:hypothetical protein Tco_1421848 [Tanacetum coccineum]
MVMGWWRLWWGVRRWWWFGDGDEGGYGVGCTVRVMAVVDGNDGDGGGGDRDGIGGRRSLAGKRGEERRCVYVGG